MGTLDHYQALMVDREIDMDLLTTVYRRLVQRYEAAPDDASALERLGAVQRAYEVLRDSFRRRRYDTQLAQQDQAPEAADVRPTPPPAVPAPATRVAVPITSFAARLDRSRQQTVATPAVATPVAAARPAPASATRTASVSILDFGRYAGWSLRQIARHDPDYLQWLLRSPTGRQYRTQIEAILQPR